MKTQNTQSGFALLIFVVVLLGLAGVVGSELIQGRTKTVQAEKIKHDQAVLQKAKQALLGYAVEYHNSSDKLFDLGRLPCPSNAIASEEGGEGDCEDIGAKHINSVGYLPWKKLGLGPLKDSSGECLWYVVSGDYKNDPAFADMLNEDSNGLLKVVDENDVPYHGSAPGDRPIALIIAPGSKLTGQDRSNSSGNVHCRGNYTEDNYLEPGGSVYAANYTDYATNHAATADTIWTYMYGSLKNDLENNEYNDRMVWITKSEYWDAIKAQGDLDYVDTNNEINKLTKKLTQCLASYASNGFNEKKWLPWPAPIGLADYRTDNLYDDQNNPPDLMGRLPDILLDSNNSEQLNDGTGGGGTSISVSNLTDCLTADEKKLWQNWKDHFFYVVSEGFEMEDGETDTDLEDRCSSDKCVKIDDGSADKVAGIVFFAGSVEGQESRNAAPVDTDEKNDITHYLYSESPPSTEWNAHQYPIDGSYTGEPKKYYQNKGDITYCIEVDSSSFFVTNCNL